MVDDERQRDRPQSPSARRVGAGRAHLFVVPPRRCPRIDSSSRLNLVSVALPTNVIVFLQASTSSWFRVRNRPPARLFCVLFLWSCSESLDRPGVLSLEAEFGRRVDEINQQTGARQLSLEELQALLAAGKPILLLDIREAEEFEAGAIPSARLLPPGQVDLFIPEENENRIVTYCTVGYRSGRAAASLEKRLGRPVYNLHGGIIEWFNQGGQVVDSSGRISDTVHPFNADWSRFIGRKPDH